jgi:hypothetical protein
VSSTIKFAQELIRFGQQLDAESNAAHDLWTWLPSYKVAQKHHGDYASEHCPSNQDVMHEASLYLANASRTNTEMTPEEEEWFTRCPCGEDHEEEAR